MKLLFIRHSLAMERDEFQGHDFDRPLVEKGVKRAKKFFKYLKDVYEIDYILTSPAKRALQTAEILYKFYPKAEFIKTNRLLPGANINDLKVELNGKEGTVAVVGHEPDLSSMIKDIIHSPNLKIKLSKPSLAEMEDGILKVLISYRHYKGCE